jgi:hypothetical protein
LIEDKQVTTRNQIHSALIGDYNSGLFYKNLCRVEDVRYIDVYSRDIQLMNEEKINIFHLVHKAPENLFSGFQTIETKMYLSYLQTVGLERFVPLSQSYYQMLFLYINHPGLKTASSTLIQFIHAYFNIPFDQKVESYKVYQHELIPFWNEQLLRIKNEFVVQLSNTSVYELIRNISNQLITLVDEVVNKEFDHDPIKGRESASSISKNIQSL